MGDGVALVVIDTDVLAVGDGDMKNTEPAGMLALTTPVGRPVPS